MGGTDGVDETLADGILALPSDAVDDTPLLAPLVPTGVDGLPAEGENGPLEFQIPFSREVDKNNEDVVIERVKWGTGAAMVALDALDG